MAVLVSFGNSIKAQGPIVTEDESKVNIYKRFTDNRVPNPPTAYAAAKEYLQRYPKDSDQYTNYFKQWIEEYEFEERECKLLQDICAPVVSSLKTIAIIRPTIALTGE